MPPRADPPEAGRGGRGRERGGFRGGGDRGFGRGRGGGDRGGGREGEDRGRGRGRGRGGGNRGGGRGGGDRGCGRGGNRGGRGGFPAGGPLAGGRADSSSSLPAPHLEAVVVPHLSSGNAGTPITVYSNYVEVQPTQGMIYHYDGASSSSSLPEYLIDSPAAPSAAI